MATVRPRNAKAPFEIHHDEMEGDESLDEGDRVMEESRGDMEEEDGEYSEVSDDSDGVIDASVQEDMDKFQETFKGIKDRFRLINRLGEGWFTFPLHLCLY
jgi:cell division control protein 7